ncbi:MAG: NfeD family protein [Gammaproteobacteria bacterium]|nr:NfeD family protein [Gammaproteobacteria bacterium]
MEILILYWHWLVFGMLLMAAEIFIPSFTIFWFGLGALVVSALLWFFPALSLSWQLAVWALASSVFALLWFKLIRPTMIDRTKAGIAREAIAGESGQVIRAPTQHSRGIVRFTTPVLGDDEWEFICDSEVRLGDRVIVRELSGNTLLVEKR